MSHFESNLSLLARRQPALSALLRATLDSGKVRIFPSATGIPTASWESGSSPLALHSRYDPLREARQKVAAQQLEGADYFVLLGFGLGYLLDALLEKLKDPSIHYFIIESDLEILRAAFEARNLSSILTLKNLHFAWPVSGPELADQWQKFFDPVYARQSTCITHLPSVSLNGGLFKAAVEIIQSQTFQIFTDINTLVAKSENFLENFVQNLPIAARAPGVVKFAKRFSGMPAVIVSAGPSLDKNIHELRGFEDNVLILSTDTALKPLLAAGIDPHFVLTGDPSHTNYLHLKGASSQQALLVAEATCFPAAFSEFEGKTLTCIFENSSLRSISDLLGNKGAISAWGSVATMALDFALLLGCNPILFIGQDLAHTGGRIYCSGVYFDEEWFAGITEPSAWQRRLQELRSGRRTVTVDDIHGKPVESTDKLTSYWNWMLKVFRDHPDVRFVNATEGGILGGGAEIVSLKEALHRYCHKGLSLRTHVRAIFEEALKDGLLYSGIDLSTLKGEIAALQDTLKLGIRVCEAKDLSSYEYLAKKLEAIKDSIYFNTHIAPLVDCLNQMGNVNFLRSKRTLSSESALTDTSGKIRRAFLDYFVSVGEALAKIQKALANIEEALDPQPDPQARRVSSHKNRYSRNPGLTIS